MALEHHQVDVVVIRLATKTMRQVIPRIHRRSQLAATRALEAEVTVTLLGYRSVTAQPNDRQPHRQVVANLV